jgi:hypothetical protein
MASVEGQRSFYAAALVALRFVEVRRPTKRRFGPDADATWTAFRGDLGSSARIDLLLRDADVQWPGSFGARLPYGLGALAADEPFGAAWVPLDDVDAEELWRRVIAEPAPSSARDALTRVALAWGITLSPFDVGPIGAADKLVVAGPSAIAAAIDAFGRGADLDWSDQVFVIATSPAHRQLAILGAALVNASKATRLVNTDGPQAQVPRGARLVVSADASADDRSTAERVTQG